MGEAMGVAGLALGGVSLALQIYDGLVKGQWEESIIHKRTGS
jgi:hypothetical protein